MPDDGSGDTKAMTASDTAHYKAYFSDEKATAADARNATKLWAGTVSSASGLPNYGDQLIAQTLGATGGTLAMGMYCTNKSATRNSGDARIWDIICSYNTLDANSQPPVPSGFSSGDKYGVTISMNALPFENPIQKDKDGKIITNLPNGEAFNPPPTETLFDKQLNVKFWSDKPDQTSIDACIGLTNGVAVTMTLGPAAWVFAAKTLRFMDYNWTVNYDANSAKVFEISFQFIYRKETWVLNIPNMANGIADVNGVIVPFPNAGLSSGNLRYVDTSSGAILAVGANVQNCTFNTVGTANFNTALLVGIP